MGILTEMCNCPNQQVIPPGQKLNFSDNLENNVIINADNKESIEEKNSKKKINNNNEPNNDAETFNVSLKGGIITSKRKKKTKDKLTKKETEKDKKEKRSSKKPQEQNMINNVFIDNIVDESAVSDTIVSDIILSEKLKLISKEKKSKMKESNKINIVIIGQKEVGKSSFCIRLVENKFEDFYIPSICNENFSKIQVYNEHNYKVNFWVILGGAQIQKQDNVFNNADFFMLLYDITKIRSFNQLNVYIKQIRKLLFFYDKEGKSPNFFLVGNKSDLEMERKIGVDFINKCIQKNNIKHFDISIKTGKNINNLIQSFIQIFDKVAFSNK